MWRGREVPTLHAMCPSRSMGGRDLVGTGASRGTGNLSVSIPAGEIGAAHAACDAHVPCRTEVGLQSVLGVVVPVEIDVGERGSANGAHSFRAAPCIS